MLDLFLEIASNVGMAFENIILLIAWLGGIIMAAKDFRIASIYWLVISAGCFLWMYNMQTAGEPVQYYFSLVLMLLSLVLMAFNILFIKENPNVVV